MYDLEPPLYLQKLADDILDSHVTIEISNKAVAVKGVTFSLNNGDWEMRLIPYKEEDLGV